MDERFLWFGLLVAIVAAVVGALLWSDGERPSWADWSAEHDERGRKGKDDGGDGDD
jgi:hypothetical protein